MRPTAERDVSNGRGRMYLVNVALHSCRCSSPASSSNYWPWRCLEEERKCPIHTVPVIQSVERDVRGDGVVEQEAGGEGGRGQARGRSKGKSPRQHGRVTELAWGRTAIASGLKVMEGLSGNGHRTSFFFLLTQ